MAPTNDSTAPPTPTPPPAPSLADLYGPQGNLVAAPPTTPAGQDTAAPANARAQLTNAGAMSPARTTTQVGSADIQKTGAAVQNVIDKPILAAEDSPELQAPVLAGKAVSHYLHAHGHTNAAKAVDAYTGVAEGENDFVTAMSSPKNLAMMYSLGRLKTAGAAGMVLDKLVNAKFSYDSIKAAYEDIPGVRAAFAKGDVEGAARAITSAAGSAVIGVTAGDAATEGMRPDVAGAGVPDEQSTLKIPKTEKAPAATTPPTHIDMADLGGKELRGPTTFGRTGGRFSQAVNAAFDTARKTEAENAKPQPEIKAEGPEWDRTHSAYIDGKKVGSVGYKVDPDGRAQIYGSNVDPKLRGQGIGQKLYQSVIGEAEANGADRITSDSTNTTPDANRVWDKLKEKGAPIEDITHPNGKPGYQVTFNKPTVDLSDLGGTEAGETPDHLLTSERQSELPEPYSVMVGTEDGMGREEHVDAFSHKDALKQAQKQFPDAREWSVHQIGQRTPSTEYSVPSGKLLSMPEMNSGKTPESTMNHEIGHAMIGQKEGLTQEGILRHTHPDISDGSARASVRWPGADLFDRVTRTIKPEKRTSVVNMMMGGIAADEVFNDTPRAANNNFDYDRHGSDARQAYDILKEAGFKHEEILDVLHKSIDANKEYLQRPEVSGIVKENAGVREPKLSKQFHMSSERLTQMHAEAQRRMGNEISDNGTTGSSNAQNGEANVASGKGTVSGADGEVGPAKVTTHEVNPEEEGDESFNFGANVKDNPMGIEQVSSGKMTDKKAGNGRWFMKPDGSWIGADDPTGEVEHGDLEHEINRHGEHVGTPQRPGIRVAAPNAYDLVGSPTPEQRAEIATMVKQGGYSKLYWDLHPSEYSSEGRVDHGEGTLGDFLRAVDERYKNEKSPINDNPESKRTATAPDWANKAADAFNAARGREPIKLSKENADTALGMKTADDFIKMKNEPTEPKTKAAFDAMKRDVDDQYNYATKDMGLKIEPWTEKGQPYANSQAMIDDVKNNQHLYFAREGAVDESTPFGQKDATGLSYQDKFRAVHDLFGHVAGENQFGPNGERRAYQNHAQMFSDEAQPAMKSLTHGQNSFVNFGPHMRNAEGGLIQKGEPGYIELKDRPFAENKYGLLPEGDRTFAPVARDEYAKAVESSPHAASLSQVSEDPGKIFQMSVGGDKKPVYYSINKDGEIAGVVNNSGGSIKRALDTIMPHAIEQGGNHLDAWDINNTMPNLYAKYGFEITKTEPYDVKAYGEPSDALKASWKLSGWKEGEPYPSVVHMALPKPEGIAELQAKTEKGVPLSDTKGFEHLSNDFYDHMEPDEREYLKGNKLLQRNAMKQYYKITPSVEETTNAMAAGAALGGWWQRYMDVFHDLTGAQAQEAADHIGPAHSEVLKQWHAAVSGNKSVEDANNLAWHSYADWLDAGKPTDRTSINNIVKQNAAQPEGSPKKGNAAISDTLDKNGKILSEGLDTSKLFKLVNSPEMRGERPFSNEAFNEKTPNALVAKTEGARKIPSMGATVAGKGNLNRLVIDAHIRDFYGRTNSGGPAAQYIADSVHLRQAAEALGLKGGEGQEQLWGTVLGLKQLLKTGLTPEEAAGKLNSDVINQIGKDYAEVIANDPEITKPGGLLDRLKEKYGVGSGSAGVGEANRKASASRAGQAESRSSQTPVDQTQLAKTAERIKGQISESKIKKPAVAVPAEEVPATPKKAIPAEDPRLAELRAADKAARDKRAAAMKKGIAGLSKPGTK